MRRTQPVCLFAMTVLVGLSAGSTAVRAVPVYFAGTGNYYEFVAAPNINWVTARNAAAASSYLGAPGHLATITTLAENNFISATFNNGQSAQFAWLGGSEPNDDGVWRWAVGPEAGTQFSLFNAPTAPFNFANWGGIEPNDAFPNEDYLDFNIGASFAGIAAGQWADAVQTPNQFDHVVGYLVEYETSQAVVPELPTLPLLGILLASLAAFHLRSWRRGELAAAGLPGLRPGDAGSQACS